MPEFSTWFPTTYLPSEGFELSGSDTDCVNDPLKGTRSAMKLFQYQDGSKMSPGFSGSNILSIELITNATGHNTYRAGGGPGQTLGKHTYTPLGVQASHYGSGQHFATEFYQYAYAMGDTCVTHIANYYWGGPIGGDEGQGYQLVAPLQQGYYLHLGDVLGPMPHQSSINTTTTQNILSSLTPQTITVVSTAGAAVGDWVAVEQQPEDGTAVTEAVKVTAVGAGTITGVFLNAHPSGVKLKPALVLNFSGAICQGRTLVNLDGTTVSAGQVTGKSGAQLTGTGTAWSETMVGGNADNIGAIAMDVDTFSCTTGYGYPFGGAPGTTDGPCKSWYQVKLVSDATHLAIHSSSGRGDAGYNGRASASKPSNYVIKPAARMLCRDEVTGFAVCEYSPHTWSVGHKCEVAICPFPDIQGFSYAMSQWTPGASARGFMEITNRGARTYDTCFSIFSLMANPGGVPGAQGKYGSEGSDTVAFSQAFNIAGCKTAFVINNDAATAMDYAILFQNSVANPAPNDNGGRIDWQGAHILFKSATAGLEIQGTSGSGVPGTGILTFTHNSFTSETADPMSYGGSFRLTRWMEFVERGSQAAPLAIADVARVFAEDNGGSPGKTRLMVQFGTGSPVQIAIEP